jgi:hypothetical protein
LAWLGDTGDSPLRVRHVPRRPKGGLNLANLSEDAQTDAEDNYRICVSRGSSQKTKPKKAAS